MNELRRRYRSVCAKSGMRPGQTLMHLAILFGICAVIGIALAGFANLGTTTTDKKCTADEVPIYNTYTNRYVCMTP
jgi:hypothetical protein